MKDEEDSRLNTQKIGGLIFLDLILILAFATLNTQVTALAATAETVITSLLATLFPYVMVFGILFFAGAAFYEALK